jgi:hypothetical protein
MAIGYASSVPMIITPSGMFVSFFLYQVIDAIYSIKLKMIG